MRRTRGWTGLRPTVFALGFVAATAGGAKAAQIPVATPSPVMAYNTVGSTIDDSGTSVISFSPLTGSSFLSPSTLSFGKFVVSSLDAGQSKTYDNTPFHIKLTSTALDGAAPDPNGTPITISGKLNGTITGNSQSDVMATFDAPSVSFRTGAYDNTLTLPTGPFSLVPSTSNNGETTLQAFLKSTQIVTPPPQSGGGGPDASPVPEPSTVLLFAATIAGLTVRHRMLRRRSLA
ncbi:MAG: PEP-CTERM sorting domain-containing protein [Isosphaeraceae bacterium]